MKSKKMITCIMLGLLSLNPILAQELPDDAKQEQVSEEEIGTFQSALILGMTGGVIGAFSHMAIGLATWGSIPKNVAQNGTFFQKLLWSRTYLPFAYESDIGVVRSWNGAALGAIIGSSMVLVPATVTAIKNLVTKKPQN